MFDDFDLYESCEEYYGRRHVIDSYQYFLSHEEEYAATEENSAEE